MVASFTLKMETADFFEMLLTFYHCTESPALKVAAVHIYSETGGPFSQNLITFYHTTQRHLPRRWRQHTCTLRMDLSGCSEKLITFYQTTWWHIPALFYLEDRDFYILT
jgi:hypothetical protein